MGNFNNGFKVIIFDLDDTLYDTSGRLDAVTPNFATMQLYDGAKEILESIASRKILLTYGEKEIQDRKIDTLGIRNLFDEIIIVPTVGEKLAVFEKLKLEFPNSNEVISVGDRRDAEIRYGNMMGFTTILLLKGKYKDFPPNGDIEIPAHEISEFKEISQYI